MLCWLQKPRLSPVQGKVSFGAWPVKAHSVQVQLHLLLTLLVTGRSELSQLVSGRCERRSRISVTLSFLILAACTGNKVVPVRMAALARHLETHELTGGNNLESLLIREQIRNGSMWRLACPEPVARM